MEKKLKTLLIIPAYNEEESISTVFDELNTLKADHPTQSIDYIVVNDGSKDATLAVCQRYQAAVIDLPVNLGLTGAFETGMKYAQAHDYDVAIQFDADGQHPAACIPDLVAAIASGQELVIGSRFVTEAKPHSLRMFGSFLIAFAIRLTTGKKLNDPTSGLRAFNKELIDLYLEMPNMTPEPETVSYFLKNKVKVSEVQVYMRERVAGESYLNLSRSIKYMLRTTISIVVLQGFRKKFRVKGGN